jgi:hypothetical protein
MLTVGCSHCILWRILTRTNNGAVMSPHFPLADDLHPAAIYLHTASLPWWCIFKIVYWSRLWSVLIEEIQ